jgi:hypothetical protein
MVAASAVMNASRFCCPSGNHCPDRHLPAARAFRRRIAWRRRQHLSTDTVSAL